MPRFIETGAFSKDFGFYKRKKPHPRFVSSRSVIERSAPQVKDTKPSEEAALHGNQLVVAIEGQRESTPGRNETIIFSAPIRQDTNSQLKELEASGTK